MQTDYSFYDSPTYKLALSILMAAFLMLFMLIFQPFGVNNYSTTRIFTLEFIGMLSLIMIWTFAASLFNEFILRRLAFKQATPLKIIGWNLWTIFFLGLAVFLQYNYLGDWHDFSLKSAFGFIIDLGTIIIFPMLGIFFYYRYKQLHHEYLQLVNNKQGQFDPGQLIHFEGQGVNDSLTLTIEDFIYARAQDNYVELVYNKQGSINKKLIRASMSSLSDVISSQMILRCHRSYIVNLYHVRAIADGTEMKLFLNNVDNPVVVSKSYRLDTRRQLMMVKNFDSSFAPNS